MSYSRVTSSVLLLALALSGCQFDKSPPLSAGTGGMDMFAPVKMRIHPLTRLLPADKAETTSGGMVEARLELTDQFGDVTKSPGALYFELFRYETFIPNHHGDRIQLWNFELNTPQLNKDHWDPITRTYLFKLPLPPDALKGETRAVLSCTLAVPHDGGSTRLQDDQTLSVK